MNIYMKPIEIHISQQTLETVMIFIGFSLMIFAIIGWLTSKGKISPI